MHAPGAHERLTSNTNLNTTSLFERPHPLFCPQYYLATNPDVAWLGWNPWVHFNRYGEAEGRPPSPLFPLTTYQKTLESYGIRTDRPFRYFLENWQSAPSPAGNLFDLKFYESQTQSGPFHPLVHFLLMGSSAGLKPLPEFDPLFYERQYMPEEDRKSWNPLEHFLHFGIPSRFQPHPTCSWELFRSLYPSCETGTKSFRNAILKEVGHKHSDRPLLFMHIPKTAGVSFRSIVEQNVPSRQCLYVHRDDFESETDCLTSLGEGLSRYPNSSIFGHFRFGLHASLKVDAPYIAFVREPKARLKSFAKYQAQTTNSLFFLPLQSGMTLEDLMKAEVSEHLNNLMTRYFAGVEEEALDQTGLQLSESSYSLPKVKMVLEEKILDRAWANILQHFLYVGRAEHFDHDQALLSDLLEWSQLSAPILNSSEPLSQPRLIKFTSKTFETYNRLDMELFRRLRQEPFVNSKFGTGLRYKK